MFTKIPVTPFSSLRRKQILWLTLSLCLWAFTLSAQPKYDPLLKPFYHGVASGDPMEDRVIIWTRVTPEKEGLVTVTWKVATDPALSQVVSSGVVTTSAERDYTVKLDVTGLQPSTTYYYGFTALGRNSLTGRTKTVPVGDVSQLRFAVVSCNNFEGGYFNAFGRIAGRSDLDAVIHLGDYIYEQAQGLYGAPSLITTGERAVEPKKEIVALDDYRQRYAWYRLDPDLRRAHQQHPFITVWDDHESANDSYRDGAENHQPETEGPWSVRKEASRRVYDEWMPIRGNASPIYRVKPFGNLVDLIMIDTRIEGRDEQINDVTNPALYAPDRTMLGPTQREWLFERLKTSKAKWKIIGNQVIFSEFNVGWAAAAAPNLGTPAQLESIFLDIWDGYPAERKRVTDFITKEKIDNVVILTGDFHSSFAFDVAPDPSVFSVPGQLPNYDPATGKGSVAVEFATPSISSANFDENLSPQQAALFEALFNQPLPPGAGSFAGVNPNPHLKYVDLDRHGYFILDLTPERAQADWYFVNSILKPDNGEKFDAGFFTVSGQNHLQQAAAASAPKVSVPAPAPGTPITAGTASGLDIRLLGTYASGIYDDGGAEIPAYDPGSKRLFVVNARGTVDVLDISDPASPAKLFAIDIKAITGGTPNSVDVKNGLVAVAVELRDGSGNQAPGLVAFFPADMAAAPSAPQQTVPAGNLPDMVTFTPDGKKLLVANEGEPGPTTNPEGSVSIIDLSGGVAGATVRTVGFAAWNGRENELRAKGVRIFPGQQAAQDLEPESIAVAPDGKTAFVTLQEANAFAVIDIAGAALLDIIPLGYKDHSRGPASLEQYNFNEPPIGKRAGGEDILFGGLSGLFFEKEENGKSIFVTVPDRGPNGDESPAGRPFLKPDYVAEVFRFSLDKASGQITILEKIPLRRMDGNAEKAITGFPNIPGVDEKPIDEKGNPLPYDPFGADLEGIVVAADGTFWMVDEYRPAIYHFSKAGMLLHRYVPKGTAALAGQPEGTFGEETLPAEYGRRRSNRGFEAVALDTDKGILYAFIQTPLANPNRAASDASGVIRMLGIDPATGQPVAEYIYPLEKPALRLTAVDKIGDAVYDAKTKAFYVIERDDLARPENKKYIFKVNLTGATNLLAPDAPALSSGKTLEQHTLDELAALGIRTAFKTKVVNLPSLGYLPGDKPEGLALLPDGSFAVLNDNDFGLGGPELSAVGLGIISFGEGNTLDASDNDNAISLRNWPVLGMYMPDGVASYQANGQTYYITANEGDARSEDRRVSSLTLDPVAFPDASLKNPDRLGRLNVSNSNGDLDGDGDYDQLYAYGARSFSVWDSFGNQVFDSSDDLERITAARYPGFFNASNTNNTFDNRSDDKGPEPEGVTIGQINGRTYAFIGLERTGGFMVYDVTSPGQAQFVAYTNNRNFEGVPREGTAGDLGPEGLIFISRADSPNGQALMVVANEVSGTTSIFGVSQPTAVLDFTLVNADTEGDIAPLTDGAVIDYARLTTTRLNIRANVRPETVGSVVFTLNGEIYSTENSPFYTLAGDREGDYQPWTPAPGQYTLTATPFAEAAGGGPAGVPLTITFNVVNSAKIIRLALVNTRTSADIQTIRDGDVLNLRTLPTRRINVRAGADPETVGSVVFTLKIEDNTQIRQVENLPPYALFGNVGLTADYNPYLLREGSYQLTVTPYAESYGQGAPGETSVVNFTVVNEPGVARLLLVDMNTDRILTEIRDGDVINAQALGITPASNLNIQAVTDPGRVEKVVFGFAGKTGYFTDDRRPYELFGNAGSAASSWRPAAGTYGLRATPFYKAKGKLVNGTALAVNFTITGNAAVASAARTAAADSGPGEAVAGKPLALSVSPNPVRDGLTIRFGEPVSGEVLVMVYDIMGRKTYFERDFTLEGQDQVQVNLSGLASRFYLLKVITPSGRQTVRIIKE